MIRIIGGRASGKTQKLIALAMEKHYDIMAPSVPMAESIAFTARAMGLPVKVSRKNGLDIRIGDINVVLPRAAQSQTRRDGEPFMLEKAIVIDELDRLLAALFPRATIAGYTISDSEPGDLPDGSRVHAAIFDCEERHENCTVQVLKNTITGEISVGWWQNNESEADRVHREAIDSLDYEDYT